MKYERTRELKTVTGAERGRQRRTVTDKLDRTAKIPYTYKENVPQPKNPFPWTRLQFTFKN